MILKETAPLKDTKRIAPLLGGVLMRSILSGAPYPTVLYNSILSRIRADREVNYVRSAMIKAYLLRNRRFNNKGNEVELTMALNEQNHDAGYRLGRLFALLEKAQEDASPGQVTKNKVAPHFKTAEVELYYGEGISREVCLMDLGDQCGIQHHFSTNFLSRTGYGFRRACKNTGG